MCVVQIKFVVQIPDRKLHEYNRGTPNGTREPPFKHKIRTNMTEVALRHTQRTHEWSGLRLLTVLEFTAEGPFYHHLHENCSDRGFLLVCSTNMSKPGKNSQRL